MGGRIWRMSNGNVDEIGDRVLPSMAPVTNMKHFVFGSEDQGISIRS